ncbi:hypothetical protein LCGC14_2457230 [marine sediment metagenome]|uniref:Uncharacterized protein n=1 Tax=marine sediment metagenome TaxID=412755 RepID=A0A0F9E886_9ZZZZ
MNPHVEDMRRRIRAGDYPPRIAVSIVADKLAAVVTDQQDHGVTEDPTPLLILGPGGVFARKYYAEDLR